MNPTSPKSNVSSYQGTTLSLETGGESKGAGGTEKPLKGISGGRSISPAACDNTLPVAGATTAAKHTLLCREVAQEAASAMPIDKISSTKTQLPHELELANKPGKSSDMAEVSAECPRMFARLLNEAEKLICDDNLKEAETKLNIVSIYVKESGDKEVEKTLCQLMEHMELCIDIW